MSERDYDRVLDIAVDGDTILVVGPDKKGLRIHSLFARTTSPVFNAMLGPSFAEGQQLAKDGRVQFALPEDNSDALEIILNVIHSRTDNVPATLTGEQLYEVAILTDKYEFHRAMGLAFHLWFQLDGIRDSSDLWLLALAASLLGEETYFYAATSALVLHHKGSYLDLAKKHEDKGIDQGVVLQMAVLLAEKRHSVLAGALNLGAQSIKRSLLRGDELDTAWHCGFTNYLSPDSPIPNSEYLYNIGCPVELRARYPGYEEEMRRSTEGWEKNNGLCLWCLLDVKDHQHDDRCKTSRQK
ncbi:hypothetical protein OQA88_12737 [Cercophora sp. LCS_1]